MGEVGKGRFIGKFFKEFEFYRRWEVCKKFLVGERLGLSIR